MDVQDDYMMSVPKSYKVGNWSTMKKKVNIKILDSLQTNNSAQVEGELISGMKNEE
jgi:hypothetical protein